LARRRYGLSVPKFRERVRRTGVWVLEYFGFYDDTGSGPRKLNVGFLLACGLFVSFVSDARGATMGALMAVLVSIPAGVFEIAQARGAEWTKGPVRHLAWPVSGAGVFFVIALVFPHTSLLTCAAAACGLVAGVALVRAIHWLRERPAAPTPTAEQ
jgi:hypothetical protein